MTQILGIGIGAGIGTWSRYWGDFIRREVIEKAMRLVMEGDEAAKEAKPGDLRKWQGNHPGRWVV